MKEGLRSFFVYVLIVYFVLSLFGQGLMLPDSFSYLVLTIFLLALTVMVVCPLLSFLTVKCKFPTFFLMSTLLLTGITYLLELFMVGFFVEPYMFEGLDLGSMQISSFEMIPLLVIVVFALFSSFLCALYRELDRNK